MTSERTSATQFERVYGELRRALMAGVFEPGQKITVASTSSALGVSAMPVREALRRLSAEGALEMRPNRSVRVPRLTRDEVLRVRELRELVEGHATMLAATRVTDAEIGSLLDARIALAAARDRHDVKAILRINEEFHFAIYRACGLQILIDVIAMMWLHSAPTMNVMFRPEHFVRYPIDHQNRANTRLIEALKRHDGPAAVAALRDEIRVGSKVLGDVMKAIDWDSQVDEDRESPIEQIESLGFLGRSVA